MHSEYLWCFVFQCLLCVCSFFFLSFESSCLFVVWCFHPLFSPSLFPRSFVGLLLILLQSSFRNGYLLLERILPNLKGFLHFTELPILFTLGCYTTDVLWDKFEIPGHTRLSLLYLLCDKTRLSLVFSRTTDMNVVYFILSSVCESILCFFQ